MRYSIFVAFLCLFETDFCLCLSIFGGAFLCKQNTCIRSISFHKSAKLSMSTTESSEVNAKSVTKEIMSFFSLPVIDQKNTINFKMRLESADVWDSLDGMHMITILFQSARTRRLAKNIIPIEKILMKLKSWDREWTERDISTFVYGIKSLECINTVDGDLLRLGAKKILESRAVLSSRAIGNALYGLQVMIIIFHNFSLEIHLNIIFKKGITSDTEGAPEVCLALASVIKRFTGDLNGQDIGIGLYGLQVWIFTFSHLICV